MNLLSIAMKSLRQRWLASSLTGLSVSLGVALMIAVLVLNGILGRTFRQNGTGYDLIVGPQGSSLELVLNSIYRIVPPIENLPWRFYEELKKDPRVERAIPIALGDSTEEGSFPILGTTIDYFDVEYEPGAGDEPGKRFFVRGKFPTGKWDAVIGEKVARDNGWDIGSKFKMVHGGNDEHVHDEEFTVVGVLKRTGTPNDRTVFVNLNGFFSIAGHDKPISEAVAREAEFFGETEEQVRERYGEELVELEAHLADEAAGGDHSGHDHGTSDIQKEVTSILVLTKSSAAAVFMQAELNEGFKAQAVNPVVPMTRLMTTLVGNVQLALVYMTGLIIAVSGIGIFVSIYNSMSDRKREIAIMRALGAGRQTVFSIILLESTLICVGGGLLGVILGHGLVFLAGPIVAAKSGILIDPFAFEPIELALIPALLVLAALVGFVPGLTAYRTDVAEHLTP